MFGGVSRGDKIDAARLAKLSLEPLHDMRLWCTSSGLLCYDSGKMRCDAMRCDEPQPLRLRFGTRIFASTMDGPTDLPLRLPPFIPCEIIF